MNYFSSWQAFALGSAFFAGLTAIFGKLGVEGLNANLATLVRTFVVMAMTAAIVSMRGEWVWPRDTTPRALAFLVASGVATGLSWLLYYRALQMAPASLVAPIDKLSVVFAIVLALVFLGEALTWRLAIGATLIVAGVLVLVWPAGEPASTKPSLLSPKLPPQN
ncbi:EamA family transporter [Rhodocyclus tenuis]|uniref:EamA family transporter n=2 Tax=Rhodocyclus TaxID=1064 RepID=A0A6L5JX89_RHOTE|nr:EamA family transporter [Rhodocyclus gracilis]MQY51200.1 EamA family transporter [Rhodocyclus gracilis]MRD71914.1 EamA family transporter [Rhodocyclus gracilis]NJA88909.1 EamA family transporter [Rhodocyclus gracilis]